jgi:hypothetical protein
VRWDPDREDLTFFVQSAHLYAAYYMLQIGVHRPFIPARRDSEPTTHRAAAGILSLVICTTAARACAKVLHSLLSRVEHINPEYLVRVTCLGLNQRELCADAIFAKPAVCIFLWRCPSPQYLEWPPNRLDG